MATLLNDRNELLFSDPVRVTGATVSVSSGTATSLIVPKNATVPNPTAITLSATVIGYVTPAYVWSYRFGDTGNFTALAATTNPVTITCDAAFLTAAGTSTVVQYRVTVTETTSNLGINQAEYTLSIPILREGLNGVDAINSVQVTLYRRTATNVAPDVTTTGNSTYTFSSAQIVGQPSGWTQTIPASSGGAYLWTIQVLAASVGSNYAFANTLWSTPVLFTQDGTNGTPGTPGTNTALVYAYQRSATTLTSNPGIVDYSFTTNAITTATLANNWQKTIPAGTDPLYVTVATAASTGSTDNILAAEWSTPVLLVQNGTNGSPGAAGINTASVFLYTRNNNSTTAPTVDTPGTATYTFATGVLSGTIPAGWTQALPAESGGSVIWAILATALANTATDSIANTEWSAPRVLAQAGANGTNGTRGSRQLYSSNASYSSTYTLAPNAAGAASYAVQATNLIAAATAGSIPTTPIEGDTVTFSNGTTYVYTVTYNASTATWNTPGTVIDGSLLVTGSVTAAKINSNGLSIRDTAGNLILSAGVDLANSSLSIPGTVSNVPTGWQNSSISISSAGALTGAGGGSVTIGGLGSTGSFGGGQVAINTDFLVSTAGVPYGYAVYNNAGISVTNTVAAGGALGNANYWRIKADVATNSTFGFYLNTAATLFGGWKANTTYIISFYARSNTLTSIFGDRWNQVPPSSTAVLNPALSANYQRYVWKINFGSSAIDSSGYWTCESAVPANAYIDVSNIQIEIGEAASGWSPLSWVDATGKIQGVNAGAGTAVSNSNITLSNTGSLTGAGGGSVSIAGLGYTGALDANKTFVDATGNIQGVSSGVGTVVNNNYTENGVLHVYRPLGASGAANQLDKAGAIKISLPQGWTSTMLKFYVEIYEFNAKGPSSYNIGGYNYATSTVWLNTFATYTGAPENVRPVRFGYDSNNKCCIWIGNPAGVWQYPQVRIIDFSAGYSNYEESKWATGWAVNWDTVAATNVTAEVTTPTPGGTLSGANAITNSNVSTLVSTNAGLNNNQINVSISSAGTIAATGGPTASGSVSISGLGYTGALDANKTSVDASGAIQGVASGAGTLVSNALVETLSLVASSTITVAGNTITKTSGTANWDAQAYSKESYTGGAYVKFSVTSTNVALMIGLNSDPTANASYTSLDYSIYLEGGGGLYAYESNDATTLGTYAVGDVLSITYDGSNIRYYKNGTVLRTVLVSITSALYLDSSFLSIGASVNKVEFGPMSSNAWSAITGQPAGIYNSNITLSNAGALSGAGGGTVTISGLGYTGALDANKTSVDASGAIQGVASGAGTVIDNTQVKVGGSNYLLNSSRFINLSNWVSNGATVELDTVNTYGGYNTVKLSGTSGGAQHGPVMRLKENTLYTVSALVKGSSAALTGGYDTNLHIQSWTDENTANIHQETGVSADTAITTYWRVIQQTFKTPMSASATYCKLFFFPLATGFTLNIAYTKLEEGNKATDWTPNPEEIKNNNITISNAGALSGAGGGSVTIGGLGYTGALNANNTYIDSAGKIQGVSSGAGTSVSNDNIQQNRNFVQNFGKWANYGTNYVTTNDRSANGLLLVIPAGSNMQGSDGPTMSLYNGLTYIVSFTAWVSTGTRVLYSDLYPDTLPESTVTLTNVPTLYKFTWTMASADATSCKLRFYAPSGTGDIYVLTPQLEVGFYTPWKPAVEDLDDKLSKTSANILSSTVSVNAVTGAGFRAGNLTWDATGVRTGGQGVAMTPGGLIGHNGTKTTFAVNATTGDASFSGAINVGNMTEYAWPTAGLGGAHLSANGFIIGNANGSGKYFQIDSGLTTGNAAIYTNIPAYLEDAQVSTVKIGDNAVTIPVHAFTASVVTLTIADVLLQTATIVLPYAASVSIIASCISTDTSNALTSLGMTSLSIYRNGTLVINCKMVHATVTTSAAGTPGTIIYKESLPAGTYTYTMTGNNNFPSVAVVRAVKDRSLLLLGSMK